MHAVLLCAKGRLVRGDCERGGDHDGESRGAEPGGWVELFWVAGWVLYLLGDGERRGDDHCVGPAGAG